jgi:hypothetical protein
MPNRLVIDEQHQLKEISVADKPQQPAMLKFLAQVISFLFHPLFIPLYCTLFLLSEHPYAFAGYDNWGRLSNLLQVFVNCTFLPLVSVLLLKGLKLIGSVQLKTRKDRIVPYMICMIFYFWNWYAFKNNHGVPEMISLSLAVFLASVLGFLANISFKISMHALATAVMSTFISILALTSESNFTLYVSLSFLITGLVGTSRLMVSDHSSKEIYTGMLWGFLSQLVAYYFTVL